MSWAVNAKKFLIAAIAFALIAASMAIASWAGAGTDSNTGPVPFAPVFDTGGHDGDKVINWSSTFLSDGMTLTGTSSKNDIEVRGMDYHISCSEIPPGPGLTAFFILHEKHNGDTRTCGEPYLTTLAPSIS